MYGRTCAGVEYPRYGAADPVGRQQHLGLHEARILGCRCGGASLCLSVSLFVGVFLLWGLSPCFCGRNLRSVFVCCVTGGQHMTDGVVHVAIPLWCSCHGGTFYSLATVRCFCCCFVSVSDCLVACVSDDDLRLSLSLFSFVPTADIGCIFSLQGGRAAKRADVSFGDIPVAVGA